MAFNGSTNNLRRPRGLKAILAPRLRQNTTGFQGAHIIGSSFWLNGVMWLGQLGLQDNQNALNNGVLLPESARGNLVLGAANHIGNHFGAFDRLFYDVLDMDDPDSVDRFDNSNKFLNVIEQDRIDDIAEANSMFADDPDGRASRLGQIDRDYRIQVRNFLDYAKLLFLHKEVLNSDHFAPAGKNFGPLESLVLNTADARFANRNAVLMRFEALAALNDDQGLFDYDEVTCIPGDYFNWVFGNLKAAYKSEASENVRLHKIVGLWDKLPYQPSDGDIAVSSQALAGPDVWLDEGLFKSLFLSGPLGDALVDAGLKETLYWHKARVV